MKKLQNMSKDEILELDRKLRRCAQLAMKPYLNLDINMRNKPERESEAHHQLLLNMDSYQKAFEVFYKMRFPQKAKDDLEIKTELVGDQINDLFVRLSKDEVSRDEMRILFPIVFYVLIMNNCFNKYATEKEDQRLDDYVQAHNENVKANGGRKVSYEDLYRFNNRQLCTITRAISEEKYDDFVAYDGNVFFLSVALERIYKKMLGQSPRSFLPYSLRQYGQVDLAVKLALNHGDLIYFGESAQAGILLREALKINKESGKPLDLLLRLYIANEIDQLLIRTGILHKLPPDVFLDLESDNALLQWYCEYKKIIGSKDRTNAFLMHLSEKEELYKDMIALKKDPDGYRICISWEDDSEENTNETFNELYQTLEEHFSITKEEVNQILDFYLNEKALQSSGKLRHTALMYIKKLLGYLCGKGERYEKALYRFSYTRLQTITSGCVLMRIAKQISILDEAIITSCKNEDKTCQNQTN